MKTKQKQKAKPFEGWGIMGPSGKLVPCAAYSKRETIKEFTRDVPSTWSYWRLRGYRAVKIKMVERE